VHRQPKVRSLPPNRAAALAVGRRLLAGLRQAGLRLLAVPARSG
jgi:hypothetical protein